MSKYKRYPENMPVDTLATLAADAYRDSVRKGFWDDYDVPSVDTALVKLALIASEVGEAVEAARKADWENFGEELADICIRVFDLAEGFELSIQSEIVSKMLYNKSREHMHGKLA